MTFNLNAPEGLRMIFDTEIKASPKRLRAEES